MIEKPAAASGSSWGITLAIVGTFLFALKSIFVKLAFAAGANAIFLLTLRMTMALPFYVAVLWHLRTRSDRQPLRRDSIVQATLLGFLGYYLASYLDLAGLEQISAQLERLTLFTYPAMVSVLAWMFLGEHLNGKIILSISLSYFGVMLMYAQESTFTAVGRTGIGVLLVVGSALSYSIYIIFAKPMMKSIGSQQFTSLAMIGSTFFVVLHFVATQPISTFSQAQPIVYVYGMILAFVCTVLPSFMINEAIMRIGATRTSVIGTVGPVLTMLLAILVLGEPSSLQHFAGMAIAICGVSFVATK